MSAPWGPHPPLGLLIHLEERQDHLIRVGLGQHVEDLPDGLLGHGVRGAVHVVVNVLDDLRHLQGFGGSGVPASWVLDTRSAGASDPGAHAGLGAVPLPWLKKHRVDSSREEAVELGPETRSQRSEQGTGTQRLLRGEGRPIAGCVDGRLYGPGVTLPGFEPASLLTSCVTLAPVQPPPCSSSSSDNDNQFSLLMGLS